MLGHHVEIVQHLCSNFPGSMCEWLDVFARRTIYIYGSAQQKPQQNHGMGLRADKSGLEVFLDDFGDDYCKDFFPMEIRPPVQGGPRRHRGRPISRSKSCLIYPYCSFGVCCVFTTTETSDTISENCTYIQNPGWQCLE